MQAMQINMGVAGQRKASLGGGKGPKLRKIQVSGCEVQAEGDKRYKFYNSIRFESLLGSDNLFKSSPLAVYFNSLYMVLLL